MRRTPALAAALTTAAALTLGAGLLLPTDAAVAVGETCRGEAATIVGKGKPITGTEGRDVIVTSNSQDVESLGGDDLICITGTPLAPGTTHPVQLDAGPGNDIVDSTTAVGWSVEGQLGEGADRFEGGSASDHVTGGVEGEWTKTGRADLDTDVDVIIGGGGGDSLSSGQDAVINADVIDAGEGDDYITFKGVGDSAGRITGGAGTDALSLQLAPGPNTIDNTIGQLRHGAVVAQTWSGMETFYPVNRKGEASDLDFIGSDVDESLHGSSQVPAKWTLRFGDGDDTLSSAKPPATWSADFGAGSDYMRLGSQEDPIRYDAGKGFLTVGTAAPASISGLEGAHLMAKRVDFIGSPGPDAVRVAATTGTIKGMGGDDSLSHVFDGWFETFKFRAKKLTFIGGPGDDSIYGSTGPDVIKGGSGNDTISGRSDNDRIFGGAGKDKMMGDAGDDILIGGPQRDFADGGRGKHDRCVAERTKSCER